MTKTLKHVGILGMKWGHRKASSGPSHPDHAKASVLKKKKLHELSNDELTTLTKRLQLEKQFKDLNKKDLGAGHKFVADTLQGAGKQLASKYVANVAESAIKTLIEVFKNR